ncbi:MAG: hypothetical protein NZZ41_03575 [Candidatus Dojkabacteria bacterium]|nr:hypothetical protein [Candidatus Dojkabacteria bacterium]
MKNIEIDLSIVNRYLLKIFILSIILFFVLHIIFTNVSTTYQTISRIRQEKEIIRKENEILIAEIEKAKSNMTTQDVIEKYGLVEKRVYYLDSVSIQAKNNILE